MDLSSTPVRVRVFGFTLVVTLSAALGGAGALQSFDYKLLDEQFAWLRYDQSRIADSTLIESVDHRPTNSSVNSSASSGDGTGSRGEARVVLVGIDEETVREFPEPIALWHHHLGDFLKAMAAAKPDVVGLDLNLPNRTYELLLRGYDKALLSGMLAMRQAGVALKLGVTVAADGTPREVFAPFLSIAGPGSVGYTLWRVETDQVVRKFDERLNEGAPPAPTLVGQMVREVNGQRQAAPGGLGSGFIDYSTGSAFQYVALREVLERWRGGDVAALRARFEGRAVLVGSVLPFVDRHYQPVNMARWEDNAGYAPGVLIHAQALRSLLGSGLLRVLPSWGLVLIGALLALVWCVTSTWLRALCAMVLGWMALLAVSTAAITHQWYLPICGAGAGLMLAALGRAGLENGLMLIERRRLRRAFAGAVSPAVLGEVLSGRLPESERVHACVLFSDIRGFTTRSEAMAPEQVIAFLNEYFEEMVAAIHDAGGTLDKFIGDGIMAFFGAPVASDAPCKGALEAANNMLASLARFNQDLSRRGEEPVRIGIGLHVGDVVVGQVGSRTRREYTAVGDVVNTASRLEGLTKDAGRALIISQAVFDALDGAARQAFEPLGAVPIRGRSDMPAWGLK